MLVNKIVHLATSHDINLLILRLSYYQCFVHSANPPAISSSLYIRPPKPLPKKEPSEPSPAAPKTNTNITTLPSPSIAKSSPAPSIPP